MPGRVRTGVLLSGSGRTLQNLIDRQAAGTLAIELGCVISDRPGVFGLERGQRAGLPSFVAKDPATTFDLLRQHRIELVLLAGYLRLLPIPSDFAGAVLNIHPSLLPKYGGRGMYGDRVHAAVLAAGEQVSGCTVHLCDEVYDHGQILLQRQVPVLPQDSVASLAARVFAAEAEAYPAAIAQWIASRQQSPRA